MLIMPIAIQMIENEEDRLFIERIYLQYEEDIFRVIRKYLGHSQDVEDVVNDVCVRMIAHIERLREIESENPKSYICKMARNATFDLLRKKRSEKAFMEREKAAHINQLRADIEGELDVIIRLADADQQGDGADFRAGSRYPADEILGAADGPANRGAHRRRRKKRRGVRQPREEEPCQKAGAGGIGEWKEQ